MAAAATFIAIGTVALYLIHLEDTAFQARQRNRVVERVAVARAAVEQAINLHLSSIYAFDALIAVNPQIDDGAFQHMAELLSRDQPGLRAIQLSPGGIVKYVYPADDPDKVRGLNLLTLKDQNQVVLETIQDGKLRVAGPTPLVQGGIGLIAREPVYLGQGAERRFWGFATLLLDYTKFMQDIPELTDDPDMEFAIRGKDGLGAQGQPFYGPAEFFQGDSVLADVRLPNGGWQLAGRPRNGWRRSPVMSTPYRLLAFLCALVMGCLAYVAREHSKAIAHVASNDMLTGMLRRHAFVESAAVEIRRINRYRHPLSLVTFDVDHFKQVNDRFGHPAGDAALVALSTRVMNTVRPTDVLGRIGGEEFAILCPETDLPQARALAERVRAAIAGTPLQMGKERIVLTASFGVVQFSQQLDSLNTMMSAADKALYRAKEEGRNRVCAAEAKAQNS